MRSSWCRNTPVTSRYREKCAGATIYRCWLESGQLANKLGSLNAGTGISPTARDMVASTFSYELYGKSIEVILGRRAKQVGAAEKKRAIENREKFIRSVALDGSFDLVSISQSFPSTDLNATNALVSLTNTPTRTP